MTPDREPGRFEPPGRFVVALQPQESMDHHPGYDVWDMLTFARIENLSLRELQDLQRTIEAAVQAALPEVEEL